MYFCNQKVSIMVLEIKNGRLAVNDALLFADLNFTVRGGQLVCLSGPAGSGKSTVAKSLLGLRWLDAGYVSIDGTLVTPSSAPTFRRMAVYVPQHFSRLGGLAHPAECLLPEPADEPLFSPRLPVVSLKGLPPVPSLPADETADLICQTLSAGAARQFVIADEPTEGLSDQHTDRILSLLRQQTAAGKPVLVVSNDSRVVSLADRRIYLNPS